MFEVGPSLAEADPNAAYSGPNFAEVGLDNRNLSDAELDQHGVNFGRSRDNLVELWQNHSGRPPPPSRRHEYSRQRTAPLSLTRRGRMQHATLSPVARPRRDTTPRATSPKIALCRMHTRSWGVDSRRSRGCGLMGKLDNEYEWGSTRAAKEEVLVHTPTLQIQCCNLN